MVEVQSSLLRSPADPGQTECNEGLATGFCPPNVREKRDPAGVLSLLQGQVKDVDRSCNFVNKRKL